jgi:hypothetical protein
MTTVRLAHAGPSSIIARCLDSYPAPALLVSYYYVKDFTRHRSKYIFRDYVLDSGAFSAFNSKVEVDLGTFINFSKTALETDKQLSEVYALDVIGDWKKSLNNTKKMWAAGVEAIPCFHFGEPWELIKGLAADYPKIAIGGAVGLSTKKKNKFAAECFARVWPKKIHGFGFGAVSSILSLPFHSCDATNWEIGPCMYASWKKFGNVSLRGSKYSIRSQVDYYLELERKAKFKWRREMQQLGV